MVMPKNKKCLVIYELHWSQPFLAENAYAVWVSTFLGRSSCGRESLLDGTRS